MDVIDQDNTFVKTTSDEKLGLVELNGRLVFYGEIDPELDLDAFVRASREERDRIVSGI